MYRRVKNRRVDEKTSNNFIFSVHYYMFTYVLSTRLSTHKKKKVVSGGGAITVGGSCNPDIYCTVVPYYCTVVRIVRIEPDTTVVVVPFSHERRGSPW